MFFISSKKLFSFSRYLSFCNNFWSCGKNSLSGEITLASRFMASRPGLQAGEMRMLPNVSRGKGDQAVEFGQLREYSK